MSGPAQGGFVGDAPASHFPATLLGDYVRNLGRFFDAETGAVRERARDDGSPGFLYSEATGFAIQDLLALGHTTGDISYLERAGKAAAWLAGPARHESGWIRTRYYFERDRDPGLASHSFDGGTVFSFDNAICLRGLLGLCQVRREAWLLECAAGLSRRLARLVGPDGSVEALFHVSGRPVRSGRPPPWSKQSGSFHAKVAEALAEWGRFAGDPGSTDAARRVCEYALGRQQDDGRFLTAADGSTHLHPHCYSAEGLLGAGAVLGEPRFLGAARRATEWALRQYDGATIPQRAGAGGCPRTDAVAQALALGCRLLRGGLLGERWWPTLAALARAVWATKDGQQGYFRYGYYEDGTEARALSYWTNQFAYHSLLEYALAWAWRNTAVLVLAGGRGSRCWPASSGQTPKALAPAFLGDRSLLQESVSRYLEAGCVRPDSLFVVAPAHLLGPARGQLRGRGIPPENILPEDRPAGSLRALHLALPRMGRRAEKGVVVVSTADNLLSPVEAVRDTLLRAALAAWWGEGLVVGVGVPAGTSDPRYGHEVYDPGDEVVRGVYRESRFAEKPQLPLELSENERFAWNSGCVVSTFGHLARLVEACLDPRKERQDLTHDLLEVAAVRKGVAVYPGTVRFADAGAPGEGLRRFFAGTGYERGEGNVVLGPRGAEVVFHQARRNLVISGERRVEVVGLSDHLIIDGSCSNAAVLVPLGEDVPAALEALFGALGQSPELRPYVEGGAAARAAAPFQAAVGSRGPCVTESSCGAALAVRCGHVRLRRDASRLRALGAPYAQLPDAEVDALVRRPP
jgi:mannose-1-phosphate guanylyltransferase